MHHQRTLRLQRELSVFTDKPPFGISCWRINDTVDRLEAQIIGSETSPYAGGVFKLTVTVPERYPFEPPNIQFITPIYHPNIDNCGRICLDSLKMPPKGSWSPALNIRTLLTTIQLLMSEPNPDDPLMLDIANEFKYDREKFTNMARTWTRQHAKSFASRELSTVNRALETAVTKSASENAEGRVSTKRGSSVENRDPSANDTTSCAVNCAPTCQKRGKF